MILLQISVEYVHYSIDKFTNQNVTIIFKNFFFTLRMLIHIKICHIFAFKRIKLVQEEFLAKQLYQHHYK